MSKGKMLLKVCHLYPDLLNLYGDQGNVLALVCRLRWRNIGVEIRRVNQGDTVDFREMDVLFLGGGSSRGRDLAAGELKKQKEPLRAAVEEGLVILAICGGYELLGHYYRNPEGRIIPGLGLLDFYTEAGPERLVGDIAIEMTIYGKPVPVTGFENHAGRTFLGRTKPLGRVLAGYGNNGQDSTEGAHYKNVFCSYLHGPILPKNPGLADHLIRLALQRRSLPSRLAPLDDHLEALAGKVMLNRLLQRKKA